MDPATILLLLNGALTLAKELTPVVQELFRQGQITEAQQLLLMSKYSELKALGDGAFTGPEWERSKPTS